MEVEEVLRRCGGVAARAVLLRHSSRSSVDAAVRSGRVVVVAQGRYALPRVEADLRAAHALNGVLSHESAALQHGWEVLEVPDEPHVTVPVKRRVAAERRRGVVLHRADLHVDDRSGPVTSQDRTLADCLRNLPFRNALAVADSALRAGRSPAWLAGIAAGMQGRGSGQARRVAAEANELAANPFESGLRAAALEVPGLRMTPQVPLHTETGLFLGRPDLVDLELGIVAEADSFAWHGSRSALVRDARRYNAMAVAGHLVLRFTWEDVVLNPSSVTEVLEAAVKARRKVRPTGGTRRAAGLSSACLRGQAG